MSSSNYREPTNDDLWAQPPTQGSSGSGAQGVAPVPPGGVPVSVSPGSTPVVQPRPDRTVFVLALVSLGLGIPLTAIASGTAGLPGLLVVWVGIVLVNAVYAWSRRQ